MTTSSPASFFDGKTSARHDVTVELAPEVLHVRALDGTILAEWDYDHLETLSAPAHVLRLGQFGSPVPARLEVHDPQLAAAIDERSVPVDRSGRSERRLRLKIVAWTFAAAASLILVAVFGVPPLANRLAPLVPHPLERKLGEAVDTQVRATFDTRALGPELECGSRAGEEAGRAAFLKLMRQLEAAAGLPIPLKPAVVRKDEVNAVALPGGRIYVFQGLIDKAERLDEIAGVIAHEIGHVAHRDGVRSVLQGAGLSLLFGVLLGDFIGGGAVVWAATKILETSYSRDVEAAADLYGVMLMNKIGADARGLATFLERAAGGTHPTLKILLDHPEAKERAAKIRAAAGSAPTRPLLDESEWAALRRICSGRR
jgi:Zn-dependent protease with chaperone function